MKESTLSFTTTNVFTNPITIDMTNAPTTANQTPRWSSSAHATKHNETVIVPPNVRSNAPAATGSSRPSASMIEIAWNVRIALALSHVRKSGSHTEKTMMMTPST